MLFNNNMELPSTERLSTLEATGENIPDSMYTTTEFGEDDRGWYTICRKNTKWYRHNKPKAERSFSYSKEQRKVMWLVWWWWRKLALCTRKNNGRYSRRKQGYCSNPWSTWQQQLVASIVESRLDRLSVKRQRCRNNLIWFTSVCKWVVPFTIIIVLAVPHQLPVVPQLILPFRSSFPRRCAPSSHPTTTVPEGMVSDAPPTTATTTGFPAATKEEDRYSESNDNNSTLVASIVRSLVVVVVIALLIPCYCWNKSTSNDDDDNNNATVAVLFFPPKVSNHNNSDDNVDMMIM